MDPTTIVLIAIALAMDCFAVSIAAGACADSASPRRMLLMPALFGTFQSGMSLGGWYAGAALALLISGFDHWIAFLLLTLVGGKMLFEGRKGELDPHMTVCAPILTLLVLSLVTSIDALGAGFSLAMLDDQIALSSLVIGFVSFFFSLVGVMLGRKLFERIGRGAVVLGGVILIGIGIRVLLEHLLA